jgi:hypothetical protein
MVEQLKEVIVACLGPDKTEESENLINYFD